jgi:hypothetical protein
MRISKAVFVCVCLVGLTQLVWSQNKGIGAFQEKGIPGYLNPHTGTFTTRAQGSGVKPQDCTGTCTGTGVFFREQFNITITNYDQPPSALVVCSANISSNDANEGFFDTQTVTATLSGNTWTCDVPILTYWTLKTPATDTVFACVDVSIFQLFTVGSVTQAEDARDSSQPCLDLPQPGAGATVITQLTFLL